VSSESQVGALVGSVLGGAYRITRLIGEGGMGWVYEARHLRLSKRVAVKLMARELAANQEALARFHREAEVTSQLGHPHLVTVMDFGTTEAGEPYLVMEYLDGEDLDHRIRRVGRLPLEAAVEITKQVASALDAAHKEGIVHRDLKPANVYLMTVRDEADFVKVLDFGVSKIKAARTRLTRATAIIGTPEYMSPEQASGMVDEVDHRADQWALACIAWEMLSGHAPFRAEDIGALFYQILNLAPQPLSKRAPDLPPAVEEVLRRALAKKMEDRYPSIKDFARAFQSVALGRPIELTPAPVMIVDSPSTQGTIAFGTPPPVRGLDPIRPAAAVLKAPVRDARRIAGDKPTTLGESAGEIGESPVRRKLKPLYLVPVAAVVVLAGVALLFRSSKPPAPTARPAPAASMPAPLPVAKVPEPNPLPELPPSNPSPPPVAVPAVPAQVIPTGKPGAKRAKPISRVDPFEPLPAPRTTASVKSAPPLATPFQPSRARAKPPKSPPKRKPPATRATRTIIEEL
jgi:serine/threonine protein kinase